MNPHLSLRTWTRLAASACLLAGGIPVHAQAPMPTPPAGWVWQGTWQDGRWDGQWVRPGGTQPYNTMPQGAYAPPPPPGSVDPETQRMADRCRNYHHDGVAGGAIIGGVAGGVIGNRLAGGNRVGGTIAGAAVGAVGGAAIERAGKHHRDRECEAFFQDHPEFTPGYAAGPPMAPGGYGPMPYGVPPGYMMVPVIQGPQAPCVETRTVTTEYVTERRHTRWHRVPYRRDKRVYTGS